MCTVSALQYVIGDFSNTYFVGNAPMGHIATKPTENNEDLSYFTVMWDILFFKREIDVESYQQLQINMCVCV